MTLSNQLTLASAEIALTDLGAEAGAGASSMIAQAETLFLYAEVLTTKYGKDAATEAYKRYATANNIADIKRANQIDLGNAKSLKNQVGKFNVFIKLGSVERNARENFITRATMMWECGFINDAKVHVPAPVKKDGMYNSLVAAARAQNEQGALLSNEQMFEAMFPVKDPATRVSSLEALATNCGKHIKKYVELPNSHVAAAFASLVKALEEAKQAELAAKGE